MKITFKKSTEQKIVDEKGIEVLSFVKSKALPTRECYSVINGRNENIGKIEKLRNNFGLFDLPKVVISVNDSEVVFRKEIQELKDIFEISGDGISITGNLYGPEFNILKDEKLLASINVEKEELGYSYLVDVRDKSNEEQILSILFGINWII